MKTTKNLFVTFKSFKNRLSEFGSKCQINLSLNTTERIFSSNDQF